MLKIALPTRRNNRRNLFVKKRFLRIRKFFTKRILHADDTAHAVALGAACGMFAAILPVIGLQTALAVGLAALFRANKLIGIPIVWFSNPVTAPFLIYLCFIVGQTVWPMASSADGANVVRQFLDVCSTADVTQLSFWRELFRTMIGFGAELWVGSVVVGIVLAIPTYFITRMLVDSHRTNHKARVHRRHTFRAKLRAERVAAGGPA